MGNIFKFMRPATCDVTPYMTYDSAGVIINNGTHTHCQHVCMWSIRQMRERERVTGVQSIRFGCVCSCKDSALNPVRDKCTQHRTLLTQWINLCVNVCVSSNCIYLWSKVLSPFSARRSFGAIIAFRCTERHTRDRAGRGQTDYQVRMRENIICYLRSINDLCAIVSLCGSFMNSITHSKPIIDWPSFSSCSFFSFSLSLSLSLSSLPLKSSINGKIDLLDYKLFFFLSLPLLSL